MPEPLSANLIREKNKLEQTSPWLTLWDVQVSLSLVIHLTNHAQVVIYNGLEYIPFPIRHEEIREEAHGRLQRIVVHVANVTGEVQYYLETNDGMRGRSVTMTIISKDNPTYGGVTQTFLIDSVTANEQVASFVLGKPIPILDVRLPGRLIARDLFPSLPVQ